MAMARITKAIFGNEYSVLTVSAHLQGEYGENGIYIGIPCVVNRMGIQRIVELPLGSEEKPVSYTHLLREIGWNIPDSEGPMFAWGTLPDGYTNSNEFVMELMEKTGVICTPGSSFGSLGEGYVRFALVLPPEEIKKAIASIKESGILK